MTLSVALRHRFGGFDLDVAFDAGPGVTALFGRSGAGKTTIVNAVAGLLRPDHGQITLDGTRFDTLPVHRRRVGYVFQDARLFPHMTVADNLDYASRYGARASDRPRIIEMLGIGALLDRRPATLSGGEKQRVALGRALLSNPRLLLMDEPLAALDGPRKAEILPYLDRLKAETGVPILYVSHAVDEVARLADHMVLLAGGRVARAGPLFDVMADPAAVPLLGVREAGAVLRARVVEHGEDGLSTLQLAAGTIQLLGVQAPVGAEVRLRVLAQDVLLSLTEPQGLSAQNILPVTIRTIRAGDGPGAAIALDAGGDALLARVTGRAVQSMGLVEGQQLFAVIKATSVAQSAISGGAT
ncbi:molybdenum ABC transporter ATP-binding protein [Tateyamaria omphalii]|uniref:molybdenum ABC transporter ATP-binding protein n=1 Tax=Tateyamaria omphalii TaxID=299262 RepID=UPI001C997B3A|nr:molybdenum ABC transporter ATP-binding protein [Tateyamaria omphalii]MBY5931898.1 molybdenum ABC transporter ATP-binding protein [Tateyamaria omphalii]